MGSDLMYLPIEQVEVADDSGLRKVDVESEKFQEMRANVKARGILQPIPVRREITAEGKERYILVDGLHRRTAAHLEGFKQVPVHVIQGISESDVLEVQIEANVHNVQTKPIQFSKQLQRIMLDNPERTIEDQGKRINKSPAWVKARLALLELPDNVQTLIDKGTINISNAIALSTLQKVAPSQVADWVSRAQTDAPDVFFAECLQAVKAAKAAKKGQKTTETGPAQKLRQLGDIKKEFERSMRVSAENSDDMFISGYKAAFEWLLQQDPVSVAAWERAEQERAAEKARKEEEKAAKKAEKATA